MLSQVVPQWFHKWGAIARCGTTHLLAAAITTFFRLAETPQFDRATLLGKRRITHGYLHVFNLIGDPDDHILGGILHVPNWRPFEFLSRHIFVFIDTEFVTLKFFCSALV